MKPTFKKLNEKKNKWKKKEEKTLTFDRQILDQQSLCSANDATIHYSKQLRDNKIHY
jgi:hypothetical protein